MKPKHNKLFLLICSLGIITSSCLIISSCSKNDNSFDAYTVDTSITLNSRRQAYQLYDIAKTKILQLSPYSADTLHENLYNWIEQQLRIDDGVSKSILYWEIALNLSTIGKQHNFQKNGSLVFNCQTNWFTNRTYSVGTKWCSISNVAFNYDESSPRLEIGGTAQDIDIDNSNSSNWSIIIVGTPDKYLFVSWVLFNQPTF